MTERITDHRYRTIDPTKLILTTSKMADRVEEHFPKSGLASVANEVAAVAEGTVARVAEIKKPRLGLRILIGIMVLLVISGPLVCSVVLSFRDDMTNLGDFLQATDAGLHMILVLAGGIVFLVGMENRMRRNQALEALSEFRSLAHLVDLHQINKDPVSMMAPNQTMTAAPSAVITNSPSISITRAISFPSWASSRLTMHKTSKTASC